MCFTGFDMAESIEDLNTLLTKPCIVFPWDSSRNRVVKVDVVVSVRGGASRGSVPINIKAVPAAAIANPTHTSGAFRHFRDSDSFA
jgi:hypothetical protein